MPISWKIFYLPATALWLIVGHLLPVNAQRATAGKRTAGEIFHAHFNPIPRKAMDAYPSAYYKTGTSELSKLKVDSTDLYKGISLLGQKKVIPACASLEKPARHMKEIVSNASEWYLALAYLLKGSTAEAAYLFHKIAETEIHPYQDEAEIIYQELTGLRTR